MSNFWQLVKINLTQLLVGSFNVESNKKKKNKLVYTILFVFLFVYIAGIFGLMAYQMGSALSATGSENILMIMAFLLGSIMVFIQVFFSSFNIIFKSKDYELLACLPIKNSTVILSKIVSFLIYCYAFSFMFFAPMAIFYFVFAGFNLLAFLFTIIGFLLLPLFPMIIGIAFSFVINFLTARLKFKNIINLVMFIIFFVALMILSQKMNLIILNITTNTQASLNVMGNIYFPAIFISKAIVYGDFVNMIYYLLVSIIPFLAIIYFISWKYKYFNSYFSQSVKVKSLKFKSNQHNIVSSLTRKEVSRYLSSPMVLLNSCTGPLVLIIFAITIITGDIGEMFSSFSPFAVVLIIVPAVNLLASTTSTSFSLEGSSFWLLKNMPISLTQIIISKILAMVILNVIPDIIGVTIICLGLKLSIFETLIIFALMFVSIVLSALIGVVINLNKCNVNWTNEIAMVKQSSSVLICMLIGLSIGSIPTILYLNLLQSLISISLYSILLIVLYMILSYAIIVYLNKKAKFLFDKIN